MELILLVNNYFGNGILFKCINCPTKWFEFCRVRGSAGNRKVHNCIKLHLLNFT